MIMLPTLVLSLAVIILNFFESSWQSGSIHNMSSTPNFPRINGSESPDESLPPVRSRYRSPRVGNRFPEEESSSRPDPPTRCIDIPHRLPAANGPGHKLDKLPFIRLYPRNGSRRVFELRKFTFSADKNLKLAPVKNKFGPVPTSEQIVISTPDGDVYAILETSTTFAGIYFRQYGSNHTRRSKMNIQSGTVTPMTKEEMDDTPVGSKHRIRRFFEIKTMKPSSSEIEDRIQ